MTWIYQHHPKKKKKEVFQVFSTNKEKKKKNGLMRDKVRIENAEIRVIK